jgi:hypothetical protein
MALFENGYKNSIVTFGLGISSKICSALVALDPQKIIIATNNDESSSINHGLISACKSYLQLCCIFDPSKLEIRLPQNGFNDFFDMHQDGVKNTVDNFAIWEKQPIKDSASQIKAIYQMAVENKFSANLIDRAKKLLSDVE